MGVVKKWERRKVCEMMSRTSLSGGRRAASKPEEEQKSMTAFSKDCLSGKRILITCGLGAIGLVVVQRLLEVSAIMAVNDIVEEGKAAQVIRKAGWPADR